MVLKETYPDGSQEWECPICGRRFIMHWPPNYKRVVLEAGDEQAMHSGGTGGVVMGSTDIHTTEPDQEQVLSSFSQEEASESVECGTPADLDDPYLEPFARWAEQHNIDR